MFGPLVRKRMLGKTTGPLARRGIMAKKKTTRKKTAKKKTPVRIDSIKYSDKRKNIPTEELRDFVREEDQEAPPTLYPRDPSLDPQLVWKGKDQQDAQPLSVPTVPIYIQEKISGFRLLGKRCDSEGKRQLSRLAFRKLVMVAAVCSLVCGGTLAFNTGG